MQYYKDTDDIPFAFQDDIFIELPKYGDTPILDKDGNPTGKFKQIGTYQKATKIIADVEATHKTTLTKITEAEYKALIAPTFKQLQTAKTQVIKRDLQNYLRSYTLASGTVVLNSIQDQSNNLKNIALSQQAIQANKWTASTDVALNSVVNINGTFCLCTTAGKTDSSACTPPTKFGVAVTDGTAEWKLLGFLVNTSKGREYFTPQSILEMSQEIELILNEALTKYDKLKAQIKACTTQADNNSFIFYQHTSVCTGLLHNQ